MSSCEADLRRAAFGDWPYLSAGRLASAAGCGPRCRWLAAVVLGAQGCYAAAATLLTELRARACEPVGALSAATLAAHRRQLGGHDAARGLDAIAVRRSVDPHPSCAPDDDGIDQEGAVLDGLLGLAADNLGTGRLTVARMLLERANKHDAGWRGRVRSGWVQAEVELAAGQPAQAVSHASRAVRQARVRGALRHIIKSNLVLAAALTGLGESARPRARALVLEALDTAHTHALDSLSWPARLLAVDLDPPHAGAHTRAATELMHAVLQRTDPRGRSLAQRSGWVPT